MRRCRSHVEGMSEWGAQLGNGNSVCWTPLCAAWGLYVQCFWTSLAACYGVWVQVPCDTSPYDRLHAGVSLHRYP